MDDRTLSRRMSYILRHAPQSVGMELDHGGWVSVDELLTALRRHGRAVSRAQLEDVVRASDKQRFGFDATGQRIRANQGHSVPVDLELSAEPPPPVLFHGTVGAALASIAEQGLTARGRHHVHLSGDVATARGVGRRRGRPVVLEVDSARMAGDGHLFYRSVNGVWLIAAVPACYLTFPRGHSVTTAPW